MLSGRLLSFVALISLGAGVGCAGVSQKPAGVDGSATGAGGTGLGGGSDARPGIDGITVITTMCGNGSVDVGELCDDGNKTPGDGCSVICQIPAGWSCTGSPSVCTMAGVCGDGILGATESCDDGNRTAGDGCAANCDGVDSGYECRVPGRVCIPACGDARKIGGEGCDDGNTMDGDGCSVVCQVEPGAVCTESAAGQEHLLRSDLRQRRQGGERGLRLRDGQRDVPDRLQGPERVVLRRRQRLLEDVHEGADLPQRHGRHAGVRHHLRQRQRRRHRGLRRRQLGRGRRLLADVHARGGLHVHEQSPARRRDVHRSGNGYDGRVPEAAGDLPRLQA